MAQAETLARPYSRAAFAAARDEHALPQWSVALGFAALAGADARVQALLGDPRVSPGQLVLLHLPPDASSGGSFARFLEILAAAGRLPLLPVIMAQYEALRRAAEATLEVRVSSAQPLDEAAQARLAESLQRRYARRIELKLALDPQLLAGVLLEAEGEVIDGSLRGRIERLGSAITHNL